MTKRKGTRTDEYKSVFGNAPGSSTDGSSGADWSTAGPATIAKLIDTITSRGGAVRFGYTRDGGAYAIGFYYGTEAVTKYCRPTEDLELFLAQWIEFYEQFPYSGGASPDQG